MPDIFVSYAREDRERVRHLTDTLHAQGWSIWWDPGIPHGSRYRTTIRQALGEARCVVVVWSRHSIDSDWVLDEAGHGYRRNVLVPVVIDDAIELPLGFGGLHTADLTEWVRDRTKTELLDQVCRDIAALLGQPSPLPEKPQPRVPQRNSGTPAVPRAATWRWVAGGALATTLAAIVVFQLPDGISGAVARVGSPKDAPGATTPGGPSTGANGDTGSGVAVATDLRVVLSNLWCSPATEGGNPLAGRAAELTPPEYSIDPVRHLLLGEGGRPVSIAPASGLGRLDSRRFIVAHFSAAPALGAERWFQQVGVNASVHVLIARDGTVKQLVPFDYAAYHAGQSSWKGLTGLNRHSLGIDMENFGPLRRVEGGWKPPIGERVLPESEVLVVEHPDGSSATGWHRYTPEQIRTFFYVACALRLAYPTIEDLLGHDQISRPRKVDPGPAFPLEEMRRHLFPGQVRQTLE